MADAEAGQHEPGPEGEGSAIELSQSGKLTPAAEALRAQAIAEVQARIMQAVARPRDVLTFRARLLKECARPGFADAAIYAKPVGGESIEGPSIRFAEAALRLFGNLLVKVKIVSSDEKGVQLCCTATDLETNSTDEQEHFVDRTVERKNPAGRQPLKVRRNSRGDPTYTVEATEDEFRPKLGSEASKLRRNRILAMLPADIVEEAMDACNATCAKRDAQDPQQALNKLVDAFSAIGVNPAELKEYLGHDLEKIQPKELADLRAVYNGLKQGEATWADAMATKGKQHVSPPPKTDEAKGGTKSERLAEELKTKK